MKSTGGPHQGSHTARQAERHPDESGHALQLLHRGYQPRCHADKPDASGRYMTVMVINEDGYINRVFHEAGQHSLIVEEFDTPFVLAAAHTLANRSD